MTVQKRWRHEVSATKLGTQTEYLGVMPDLDALMIGYVVDKFKRSSSATSTDKQIPCLIVNLTIRYTCRRGTSLWLWKEINVLPTQLPLLIPLMELNLPANRVCA